MRRQNEMQSVSINCKFCKKSINKCKSDQRGLCIKSPQSDGKWVKK